MSTTRDIRGGGKQIEGWNLTDVEKQVSSFKPFLIFSRDATGMPAVCTSGIFFFFYTVGMTCLSE